MRIRMLLHLLLILLLLLLLLLLALLFGGSRHQVACSEQESGDGDLHVCLVWGYFFQAITHLDHRGMGRPPGWPNVRPTHDPHPHTRTSILVLRDARRRLYARAMRLAAMWRAR